MNSVKRRLALMRLASLWSATRFRDDELSQYAERFMLGDARRGVMAMAALSLLLHLLAALLYVKLGHGRAYLYTYSMTAALALHVLLSARAARQLRELYALGTTLLVVTSAALVLLAHEVGSVSGPLLASVVLLFMVVPLVPWGIGHCAGAIGLVYGVFTLSTASVVERFPPESLWTLQFLMLASALTAIAIVTRSVYVRREDIKVRFRLERAHRKVKLLSQQDPLTGAWNRRFLETNFRSILERFRQRGESIHFAVLDIDNFKGTNDRHGHHHGDVVLRQLVRVFRERLGEDGHIIRLGGDEFALLYCGDDIDAVLNASLSALGADAGLGAVTASFGVVRIGPGGTMVLDSVYRRADQALYSEKRRRGRRVHADEEPAASPTIGETA